MGLDPVQHHRTQALHEGERDPAQEVVGHGALLLPRLGGHPPGQPPQLVHRRGVEPPEGLRHHRDEGDALVPAELARAVHLPVVGERERVAGGRGRAGPGGLLVPNLRILNPARIRLRVTQKIILRGEPAFFKKSFLGWNGLLEALLETLNRNSIETSSP